VSEQRLLFPVGADGRRGTLVYNAVPGMPQAYAPFKVR
jgi:hypothetical protein